EELAPDGAAVYRVRAVERPGGDHADPDGDRTGQPPVTAAAGTVRDGRDGGRGAAPGCAAAQLGQDHRPADARGPSGPYLPRRRPRHRAWPPAADPGSRGLAGAPPAAWGD